SSSRMGAVARPGNWLILALAALCLGLGFGWWRDQLRLSALQAGAAANAALAQQNQKEIVSLRKKVQAAESAEAARLKRAEENRQARAALESAQRSGSAKGTMVIRFSDIIKDHPEAAALRERQVRRSITILYGDAIASLRLPPDKAAALTKLLVEQQFSQQDAQDAAQAAGIRPDSREYGQAMTQALADKHQQMLDLIGETGVAALGQASQISGWKSTVQNTYGMDLAAAGVPLDPGQMASLAQIWGDSRQYPGSTPPGVNSFQPDSATWLSPIDHVVLNRSAAILSGPQLEALKSSIAAGNQENALMQPYFKAGQAQGLQVRIESR